ncbi:uncharacterized protein Bfra_001424 [Botrytis fragariae]|uniref:F-box domain-containing protein n=1 Tax=Botrytis fragariae TaxID=1964551 RepID=A0A8H6B0S1_9HELO|nr:uncharacterized protein Bfra_001424 [Botrytis fragariae]KAF5877063.1 hypothetical protein Bfra_001424 [Botrytis fragariae]
MDSLAPELLKHILSHLPISSLRSCRFVDRTFSIIAFSFLFSHIPHWLDCNKSLQFLVSIAHDAFNRPAVIWSPWATIPDVLVDEMWLQIVWKLFKGFAFHAGGRGEELTAGNFARLSGVVDMSEARLRTAQSRYLLFKSYTKKVKMIFWGIGVGTRSFRPRQCSRERWISERRSISVGSVCNLRMLLPSLESKKSRMR